MAELTKEEMIELVEKNIDRLDKKEFNVYFYVLDTKNNPSGSLEYLYQTALTLKKMGYKVTMIHQEQDFVGVKEWLGEEYANLEHKNIDTDNVEITPSDFLFVPETFANVLIQTKKLPCKRVMIVENYNYMSEFMPAGVTPGSIGINDVITTTNAQAKKLQDYFPGIKTHVVSPMINPVFREATEPQSLIVNVIARDQSDVNRIIKPFYWKNPVYKWISFRDLRGVSQDVFAEALREGAFTILVDEKSNFSYSALEAMRCGTILIAKATQHPADWMVETKDGEESLSNCCLWFDDIDSIPDVLAGAIRTWTYDKIPQEIFDNQKKTAGLYTKEQFEKEIEKTYIHGLFDKRKKDFEEVETQIKNNTLKVKGE